MKFFKKYIYHPIKNLTAKIYVFILQNFFGLNVIGITGSAGKTTTKEMLAGILRLDGKTVWSFDNIDPVFNIASTILRCTPFTKYLILEMGVEYPNEMDFYMWIVKPKIGVITNIFLTHTLYFGDEKGVLKEKGKLIKNTKIAVLNENNKYLLRLKFVLKAKEYWFNGSENAIESNSNAARKVAEVFGISDNLIEKGLADYQKPKHRLDFIKHKSGAFILDDTYNSNPEAFLSSLKYFNNLAGKNVKIAVVGDMLELGEIEIDEHKRISHEIKKSNFQKVFGVGKLVKYITFDIYANALDLVDPIKNYLKPKNYIFLKGSRSIGLDKLVDAILS
jgi:UDP-N-acetylmuramoyl-tripeptide--D-alanyl-D-alanine ligase